eukprot:jgi/Hompol1/636/HPOL_004249-RA
MALRLGVVSTSGTEGPNTLPLPNPWEPHRNASLPVQSQSRGQGASAPLTFPGFPGLSGYPGLFGAPGESQSPFPFIFPSMPTSTNLSGALSGYSASTTRSVPPPPTRAPADPATAALRAQYLQNQQEYFGQGGNTEAAITYLLDMA